MTQYIEIIINPAAGQQQPVLSIFNNVFRPLNLEWDISITHGPGDARRLAAKAVQAGVDIVGVYGGDGTVSEVSTSLAGTNVPLAIFPGGTGNVLARELGLPVMLHEAARLLGTNYTLRQIDIGMANDRAFLVTVAAGIFAETIRNASRELKDRLGFIAYGLTTIQAMSTISPIRYQLTIDGNEVECTGVTCLVANCLNFVVGGISMSPTIDMEDGKLDVIVIRNTDLQTLLALAAGAITPDHQILDPIQHWQGTKVTLRTDPPQPITYDGEMLDPGADAP